MGSSLDQMKLHQAITDAIPGIARCSTDTATLSIKTRRPDKVFALGPAPTANSRTYRARVAAALRS